MKRNHLMHKPHAQTATSRGSEYTQLHSVLFEGRSLREATEWLLTIVWHGTKDTSVVDAVYNRRKSLCMTYKWSLSNWNHTQAETRGTIVSSALIGNRLDTHSGKKTPPKNRNSWTSFFRFKPLPTCICLCIVLKPGGTVWVITQSFRPRKSVQGTVGQGVRASVHEHESVLHEDYVCEWVSGSCARKRGGYKPPATHARCGVSTQNHAPHSA